MERSPLAAARGTAHNQGMPGSGTLILVLASALFAQGAAEVGEGVVGGGAGGVFSGPEPPPKDDFAGNDRREDEGADDGPRDEKVDNPSRGVGPASQGPRTAPGRSAGSPGTPGQAAPVLEDAGMEPFDPLSEFPGSRGAAPQRTGAPSDDIPPGAAQGTAPRTGKATEPATETGRRAQSSLKRAKGLAEGFLRDGRERQETPLREAPRAPGASGDAAASIDPSRPSTPRELAVTYESGFRPIFEARGLRVARDADGSAAVLRKDGTPAAPAEVADVVRAVNAAPAALLKRPDFLAVLPPERHAALKDAYRSGPSSEDFRHVALDAGERDFLWDASCSRVAGGCNPHAREPSYKRGEQVSPETLDAIWDSLEEGPAAAVSLAAEKLGRRRFDLGAALGRVMGGFGSVVSFFGGGAAVEPQPDREEEAGASPEEGRTVGGAGEAPLSNRPRRPSAAVPPPPESEAASKPWYLLLAFAGAGLALWGLWYRRSAAASRSS